MFLLMILIIIVAILGTPLFIVIGLSAIINFALSPGSGGIRNVILEISGIADMPLLHAIPLFTFAGYLLAHSNASKRLVRLTKAGLGWMPGGLPIVTICVCSIFTAFTGASGVTIVALGGLLLPALLSEKYGEKYSLGLITASGSFGLLFPPSLPIILFGVIASMAAKAGSGNIVQINDLFIAGIVPGLFIMLILSIHAMLMSRKFDIEKTKFSWKEIGKALSDAKWEIPLPVLLFAGIYTGKLVISDAAVVTVIYILIVELFLTKDIKIREIPKIMKESMVLVGAILVILSVSLAATNFIIYAQIPQKLFAFIQKFISNKWIFLVLLNIFLLIVGCIMDIFSALVVVVPLILPIAESYNISLIHLGIIFLANLQIGYITPPVGMDLFIASIRFKKPILTLWRSALIFIGLMLAALIVITYVPDMSLWFKEKPSIVGQWELAKENGDIDRISMKANGIYIRRTGEAGFYLLEEPVIGGYEIKGNKLFLKGNNGVEEYKYEIFNDGAKILLDKIGDDKKINNDLEEKDDQVEIMDDAEDNDDFSFMDESTDDESDDYPWEDDEAQSESDQLDDNDKSNLDENKFVDGRVFYENKVKPPLRKNAGMLIAKWEDEKGNSVEFHFNGEIEWQVNGVDKNFNYNIKKGNKLEIIEILEDSDKTIKSYYSFKVIDNNKLILKSIKNKNIVYELKFVESYSDR